MAFRTRPVSHPGLLVLLATLAAPAAAPVVAAAQSVTTATVRGTVHTPRGEPVGDARVSLEQVDTGNRHRTLTGRDGSFVLRLVPPGGPYALAVSGLGLGTVTREGIHLRVGETVTVEIEIRREAVPVEGIQVRISRDGPRSTTGTGPLTLLDEETIAALPVPSRDLTDLAVLSPMVTTGSGGGFSIGGRNTRYNTLLVDGLLTEDVFGTTAGGVPGGEAGARLLPLEALSQFEVLVAPFDVRLTGFTGGVLNAVTRRGTNRWRGSAFAYSRTDAFTGDLLGPGGITAEASGVDRRLIGFSLGGPLVRDRAHLFVATELEGRSQPPDGFNLTRDTPLLTRVAPAAVDTLSRTLEREYALDAGDPGPVILDRSTANVFARLDWRIDARHSLTLQHVFAGAEDDAAPNRTAFEAYELSSNGVVRDSRSHSTSLQLRSSLGSGWSNELRVGLRTGSDEAIPLRTWPQLEVDVSSNFGSTSLRRSVRAGSDFFAQANQLDQTALQLSDEVVGSWGDHTVTFGLSGSWFHIDRLFQPGVAGSYRFDTLEDLAANIPSSFQRTLLADGVDPRVDFSVAELGAYAQDEWRVGDRLTLRYGLRLDMPVIPDRPGLNPDILELFGHRTDAVPDGQLQVSPRVGFTWTDEGRRATRIRGGVGLFRARPPLAWLADAYANTGLRTRTLVCTGRNVAENQGPPPSNAAPPFVATGDLPDRCANPDGTASFVRTVTLLDEDFEFPRDLKLSLGVDRELGERIDASASFTFSRSLNQVFLEDLNIGTALEELQPFVDFTPGYGGRPLFGAPTPVGRAPVRPNPRYAQVIRASNRSEDWAWTLAAEIGAHPTDDLQLTAAYAFSRSRDRMSLTANDMVTNFGTNPVAGHPNRPPLRPSRFERPHKVVATISGRPVPGWDDTRLSLLYTGQSGLPFTYVYRFDVNGDGYPGPGPAQDRNNDPFWVPDDPNGIPASIGTKILLSRALGSDECLAEHRGRMVPRNACRTPWQHRLDLRLAQTVRAGGLRFVLQGDLVNLLNLLNDQWGRILETPPTVALMETSGRAEPRTFTQIGDLQSIWGGGVVRTSGGELRTVDPWHAATPASQWQAQVGLRVEWR